MLPRIAIIERSTAAARQLAQTLTEIAACEVVPFENARDALIGISRQPPEVIITEWELPDIDVAELLAAFGSPPGLRAIPVAIITSRPKEEVSPRALNLGARIVLSKPISRQNLRRALESVLPAALNPSTRKESAMVGDIRSEVKNIDKLAPLPSLVCQGGVPGL